MTVPERATLQSMWRALAARRDWRLADDEAQFIDQVLAEYARLDCQNSVARCGALALWRSYGTLVYAGMVERRERAAFELLAACVRLSLRGGWTYADAEEIAQEMVARALERLGTLRSPQAMLTWALRIQRTVQNERRDANGGLLPLERDDGSEVALVVAPDLVLEVEQAVLGDALLAHLRRLLPKDFERFVVIRCELFGDKPRDIAAELGLPQPYVRLAKSRALQRLRDDAELLQFLRELAGDNGDNRPNEQGTTNDTPTNT